MRRGNEMKSLTLQNMQCIKCKVRVLAALVAGLWLLGAIIGDCYADPDKAAYVSKAVYRLDEEGDYKFDEIEAPATYEFTAPHETDGIVYSITCSYTFTGEVTMEVSTTGKAEDYIQVVNGAPLDLADYHTGNKITWRATLAPQSSLTEVVITYMDASGVVGGFGNPELSGFLFRKPVYIKFPSPYPSPQGGDGVKELFHYQMPIKVGESSKSEGCDVYLKGVIQADFADVRFTLTDQETLIPHYLESITGEAPGRTAKFYVKLPQLPEEGLLLYLYYGNSDAADLSDGKEVFDFFDDFDGYELDREKWNAELDNELSYIEIFDSRLRLDGAKVTSKAYEFKDGIIEYRAKSTGAAIEGIIGQEYVSYSSTYPGAEHAIALGTSVKANEPKAITLDKYYSYRIIKDGEDLTFQRYDQNGELEAEAVSGLAGSRVNESTGKPANPQTSEPIGLYATADSLGSYYDYIRVRQYAALPPQVDLDRTASAQEEVPNIAEFNGVTIAANGDLVLGEGKVEGEYISQLIHAPFKTRIIVPSWEGEGAAIDISAEEYAKYREECVSGSYYYASKGDFTTGDKLRWRARFSLPVSGLAGLRVSESTGKPANRLTNFTMDFRDGAIEVIKPNGGEYLTEGAEYAIVWDAYDYEPSYKFKLYYSIDGGKNYNNIATVPNKARYAWLVSELAGSPVSGLTGSQKCLVKISDSLDPSVYDLSNSYFSIGPEAPEEIVVKKKEVEEEEDVEEIAEEIEEERKPGGQLGTQLYELLVKIGDNAGYQEGDIVMVKPAGFIWGSEEKNSEKFIIVQAYLTESEAGKLMEPEIKERYNKSGNLVRKLIKRRRHKVDLEMAGVMKKNLLGMRQLLRSRPLVDIEMIKTKPVKQPAFIERMRERNGTRGKVIVKGAE